MVRAIILSLCWFMVCGDALCLPEPEPQVQVALAEGGANEEVKQGKDEAESQDVSRVRYNKQQERAAKGKKEIMVGLISLVTLALGFIVCVAYTVYVVVEGNDRKSRNMQK